MVKFLLPFTNLWFKSLHALPCPIKNTADGNQSETKPSWLHKINTVKWNSFVSSHPTVSNYASMGSNHARQGSLNIKGANGGRADTPIMISTKSDLFKMWLSIRVNQWRNTLYFVSRKMPKCRRGNTPHVIGIKCMSHTYFTRTSQRWLNCLRLWRKGIIAGYRRWGWIAW